MLLSSFLFVYFLLYKSAIHCPIILSVCSYHLSKVKNIVYTFLQRDIFNFVYHKMKNAVKILFMLGSNVEHHGIKTYWTNVLSTLTVITEVQLWLVK